MGKYLLLIELFFRSILPPFYSFKMIERICKNKLIKNQNDKSALWILSNLYINYKKFNDAKPYLKRLFMQDMKSKAVRLLLSSIYYNQGEYGKVKEILEEGKVLELSDKENFYLADSLLKLKEYEESIKYFFKFLKKNKTEYIPFVKLGYAYYMQGLFEPAIDSYESANKLSSGNIKIEDSIKLCMEKLKESQTLHKL